MTLARLYSYARYMAVILAAFGAFIFTDSFPRAQLSSGIVLASAVLAFGAAFLFGLLSFEGRQA